MNEEKEGLARKVMEKMTMEQPSDLKSFYNMMGQICSKVLERKLQDLISLDEEFWSFCMSGLHGFSINTVYTAIPSGILVFLDQCCTRFHWCFSMAYGCGTMQYMSQLHQNLPKKSENGHFNLTNDASSDSESSDGEENDDSIVIHVDNFSEIG
ncbi:hypothetical protein T459_16276 [Capsicum annuum]|uniref:Uncharacterized protein n=1 Tax=Capsicum annuum TaxID=4072 RepID=A0A2G2Z8D1_CAPAN|nr:hypothetical protein T459_16276 [Capsicum annuum]